jgi:ABC-type proline/glycine betaine transport system ATPase subunit
MASALRIADRIHLLSEGQLVMSGTPLELSSGNNDLASRFIRASAVDVASARAWRDA